MTENIRKFISTCQKMGLLAAVIRIVRYMTNWRVRREDIIWFVKRIHIGEIKPTTKVHSLKYYLHAHDPGISRELAIYHIHEPNATNLFKKHIDDGMDVVDIGSNLGYYALLAATLVGQKGKVLAIEPEPQNHKLLEMNIQVNHIRNIETVQCAVGAKDGISEFYITEASNTNSLILPTEGKVISSVKMKTKRLDTLLEEINFPKVDFLRMDIEGGEIIAIEGMKNTLKKYKPTVLTELHCDVAGPDSIVKLLKSFETFGYGVKYIVDRDQDFPWKKTEGVQSMSSMNKLMQSIVNFRVVTVLLR